MKAAKTPASAKKAKAKSASTASSASRGTQNRGAKTRERILRVAERLFAEHGYDGVSVRSIAKAANVQLALLTYYFQSKPGLYRAVFQRRIDPISVQRRDLLASILHRNNSHPSIADILDALARPWVELRDKPSGQYYSRLIAREVGDPREASRGIVKSILDPIAAEFIDAMEQALPHLPRAQIHWAYHFFIGALLLILANPSRMKRLSKELCKVDDSESLIRAIVDFSVRALPDSSKTAKQASS